MHTPEQVADLELQAEQEYLNKQLTAEEVIDLEVQAQQEYEAAGTYEFSLVIHKRALRRLAPPMIQYMGNIVGMI